MLKKYDVHGYDGELLSKERKVSLGRLYMTLIEDTTKSNIFGYRYHIIMGASWKNGRVQLSHVIK